MDTNGSFEKKVRVNTNGNHRYFMNIGEKKTIKRRLVVRATLVGPGALSDVEET